MTVDAILKFRSSFWGTGAITGSERRAKVAAALAEARAAYVLKTSIEPLNPDDYPDQLLFKADGKFVCQKHFANLVGMCDSKSFKNKLWVDEVKIFVRGIVKHKFLKLQREQDRASTKDKSAQCKLEHAYVHIKTVVESQMMDKSAHANYDNHLYLPYQTKQSFYDEYVYLCNRLCVPLYAKKTTFFSALKNVVIDKKRDGIHIRMSNSKGMYHS